MAAIQPLHAATATPQRMFRIRHATRADEIRVQFEAGHRDYVRVPHFLNGEDARVLYRELARCDSWGLKLCDGRRVLGLPPIEYASADARARSKHAARAYRAAQHGFAFLREELWGVDAESDARSTFQPAPPVSPVLREFLLFLHGATFSAFASRVFGVRSVEVVRVTVERYQPGHFSGFTAASPATAHFGFCFDVTPAWVCEWGGLFELCSFGGGLECTYLPRFNCMTLFGLSRSCGISWVAPFAKQARYAIVGQLAAA
jgi:SM-20-related protein